MSELAFVVLAHNDPDQVRRLLAALDPAPVFLHVDARTPDDVFRAMTADLGERIHLVRRAPTHLASWTLVAAELRGLQAAVEASDAEHIAVLSGADYPLAPLPVIQEELGEWRGHSWVASAPLPSTRWSSRFHGDGGLWRLRHRFLTRRDRIIFVGRVSLRLPWRRRIPGDVELRASSEWKVLSRRHAELLLDVIARRPDLVDFWRHTLVPDETFIASVLSSPALVGDAALPMVACDPWYIEWPLVRSDHPRWLTVDAFDRLVAARNAPRLLPGDLATGPRSHRKLFARKFSSVGSGPLLDRIDRELRSEHEPRHEPAR
jgi:hypothetical protein